MSFSWGSTARVRLDKQLGLLQKMFHQFMEATLPLIYRAAAYFMLTILDDPAVLAMAFC